MLESVLADVLTRILGQYLQGIDRESVRFGAWSGLIELRSVALRPEALAVLFENLGIALPVTVDTGFISLLRLVVPWKTIGTTPVQIHMDGVTLIASPVRGDGSEDSQLEVRDRRIKRAKLDTDDAVREAAWDVTREGRRPESETSWSSWLLTDQLRATIIDNVQIHLSDIILRFEDPFSNPKYPYVASVHCESLRAVSANSDWEEAFVQHDSSKTMRKLLEIKGFRVDWAPIVTSTDESGSPAMSPSAYVRSRDSSEHFSSPERLRRYVSSSSAASTQSAIPTVSSLIHHVDGSVRLRVKAMKDISEQKDFREQEPVVDLGICFPDVIIELNDAQYTSLVQTSLYFARLANRGFRPTSPKARWKWAVDQLLPGCTARYARAHCFTEVGLANIRHQRDLYIAYRTSLLKARRTGVDEPKQIGEELERMESAISLTEVLAYRDAVDCQIDKVAYMWLPENTVADSTDVESRGTSMSSFWRMLGYESTADDEALSCSRALNSPHLPTTDQGRSSNTSEMKQSPISTVSKVLLSLRVAFWLRNATVRLSERGYPVAPVPRVEFVLRDLQIGVMYSSAKHFILESLLGSVEAWDLQTRSMMVYSRHTASTGKDHVDDKFDGKHASYPRYVSEAIESIRSGSNPAKEFLVEENAYCKGDTQLDPDLEFLDDVEGNRVHMFRAGTERIGDLRANVMQRSDRGTRDSSSLPTFRVTEGEFLGGRGTSHSLLYVCAMRYSRSPGESSESTKPELSVLEVSVGTLEAIVDGPKGSFLWGLKFWQPKGLIQDPILSFLGAAAGARIAELRIELQEALLNDSVPLQVNAVILAPRFVIPSSATGPAIVVNMGTLGICTTDSSPGVHVLTPKPESKNVRYSNYVLSLDDLGIYFSPDSSTAVSRSTHHGGNGSRRPNFADQSNTMAHIERIIRPFSLRFVLQTLRDASVTQVAHSVSESTVHGDSVAKVRLRGNVPELSLVVTQRAFQHIIATIRSWGEALRTSVPVAEVVSAPTSDTYHELGRVQLGAQDSVTVFPHTKALFSEEEGERQTFASRNSFSFVAYSVKIVVDTVSVEVREDIDARLITAVASGFMANIIKRGKTDLCADVSLSSLSVTDGSRGSTATFRRLVYSGSHVRSEGVSPPRSVVGAAGTQTGLRHIKKCVSVHYNLDLTSHEQHVLFRFLSLHVNCVRETYLRLILFFDRTRKHLSALPKSHLHGVGVHETVLRKSGPSVATDHSFLKQRHGITPPAAGNVVGKISVTSEFDGFICQLVSSKGVIAVFEMKNSVVDYVRERDGTKHARGTFGSFSIQDLTSPISEHASVLKYEGSSTMLEASLLRDDPRLDSEASSYDEWHLAFPVKYTDPYHLNASFRKVRVLVVSRFLELLQQYFAVFLNRAHPALSSIIESGPVDLGDVGGGLALRTAPTAKVFVSFDLWDLSCRVPRHSLCSSEAVVFNFSTLHIDNFNEQRVQGWFARLDGLQGTVHYLLPGKTEICQGSTVSSTFLSDCSAEMVIEPTRDAGCNAKEDVSQDIVQLTNVRVHGPLHINLSEAQYSVLYFVLTENVGESLISDNAVAAMEDFSATLGGDLSAPSFNQNVLDDSTAESGEVRNSIMFGDFSFPGSRIGEEPGVVRTMKVHVSIPTCSLEISRGWDVSQDACKVLGVYMSNLSLDVRLSTPSRKVVEFGGSLIAIVDLRPESTPPKRPLVVSISSESILKNDKNVSCGLEENVSMSYEKEGTDRPSIIVSLSNLQLEVIPELLRDLTYLSIPGWPFLKTSAFAPDIEYIGRTLTLLLRDSQIFLLSEISLSDRRALVLTGEFELKVDWMRKTGARALSLSTKQLEVSSVDSVPAFRPLRNRHGSVFEDLYASRFERSHAPLIYPTDSFFEFIEPDVDAAGRRVCLSLDAALCIIRSSEIPLLQAIVRRLRCLETSYLSNRDWKQPSFSPSSYVEQIDSSNPKEAQKRKARESLTASLNIPVARYLVTDDRDGRFVPIAEFRLSSFDANSHATTLVQVEGEITLDLFNPAKGCWEPAVEPWRFAASMSHGQSGAKAYVIRSDERLNINIAPTTIRAALTMGEALREVTTKSVGNSAVTRRNMLKQDYHRGHSKDGRPSVAAFLVRNELGIPIQVSIPGKSGLVPIAMNCEIEVGAQSEALVSSNTSTSTSSREDALRCSISIPCFLPRELSAADSGKYIVTFVPRVDPSISQSSLSGEICTSNSPMDILWEVELRKGVPLCTVRSPFRICNDTKMKLDVAVVSNSRDLNNWSGDEEVVTSLDPGERYSIPILVCSGVIHLRPAISSSIDSALTSSQLSRPFQWSSVLPRTPWLMSLAQESRTHQLNKAASATRSGVNFPLVECQPVEGDGHAFFYKVVPTTAVYNDGLSACEWLDISIRAPIVLSNRLPGRLSYRVCCRDRLMSSSARLQGNAGGSVLATGVIEGQNDAHLHLSDEDLPTKILSLAFCNTSHEPKTAMVDADPFMPSSFGPPVSFGELESGKVSMMTPSPLQAPETRGPKRRHFRTVVRFTRSGVSNLKFHAALWVRNRSDSTVEVCSRSSFYATGSAVCILRACPPADPPDSYACLEGHYLSIRLPRVQDSDVDSSENSIWWTTPNVIDELNKPIAIDLPRRSLELEIRPARGAESDTFVAIIRNSSWILNNTTSPMQWCHKSSLDAQGNCPTRLLRSLQPGHVEGLHWDSKSSVRAVHLRICDTDGSSEWIWSPPVPLDIGFSRELPAKMYRPKTHDQYIARVESKEIAGTSRALIIHQEDRQNPPYRIINLCRERAIAFSQTGSRERPWLVRAGKNTRYSWDDPLARPEQRNLSVRILEKEDLEAGSSQRVGQGLRMTPSVLNIDKIGDRVMVLSAAHGSPVVFNISVDGATKVVTLFDDGVDIGTSVASMSQRLSTKPKKNDEVPVLEWDDIGLSPTGDQGETGNRWEACQSLCDYPLLPHNVKREPKNDKEDQNGIDAAIFLQSIGISLIDGTPEELMYLSTKGLLLNYESFEKEQCVALTVERIQIDNQLDKTPYPVLLWFPSVDGNHQGEGDERLPSALSCELHRDVSKDDIFMVKSFRASVRPFNVSFEEGLLTHTLKFLHEATILGEGENFEKLHDIDEEGQAFLSIVPNRTSERKSRRTATGSISRRIYVHDFTVDASAVRLTSAGSGSAIAKAAGLGASARTVVGLLVNVENCTFEFPSLRVQNVFDSLHHFGILVRTYYLTQVDNQRIKLLTSNSLMGNPAALFDAVGTGARDFLTEPGRAKGSAEFLASVGRGSRSLLTHTVGGIVESVSSIPRAVSSGLEKAVGDNEYLAERERIRGSNLASGFRGSTSRNPAQGLATGALSLAHGISSGVTGFIREPVAGARQGGAGGLLKGIGKAFIGGVAKPVAGAMDFVAEPAAGLSRTIANVEGSSNSANDAEAERPPRAFRSRMTRIECYDRRYSIGAWLLRAVGMSSGANVTGQLVDWVELSERQERVDRDGDLWVWYIVQRYSRSMPGAKKQVPTEVRRHGHEQGGDIRRNRRPEKTRVALVTNCEIVVATLDCKLVALIPLWPDAKYELVGDVAVLIVKATVEEHSKQSATDNILHEAKSLIHAPWDVTANNRRRPTVGTSVIERIECVSLEARKELEGLLRRITTARRERRDGRSAVESNGEEMSAQVDWHAKGDEIMPRRLPSEGWKMRGWTARGGIRVEEGEDLTAIVRKLSASGTESSDGRDSFRKMARVVLANKLGQECSLRLKAGKLEGGQWETEAPMEIEGGHANLMEMRESAEDSVMCGEVVYDGVEGGVKIGEMVVEVSKRAHAEATVTTRASGGVLAEVDGRFGDRQSRGESGTAIVVSVSKADSSTAESNIVEERDDGSGPSNVGGNTETTHTEEELVQQLVDIGFGLHEAVEALSDAGGDLVRAVDILTQDHT